MAKSELKWDGLKEYMDALKNLPAECVGEAEKLIQGSVNSAYQTVATEYAAHQHTGTLRKRLVIKPLKVKGKLVAGLELVSGSPIAWLFDNGSKARHWASGKSTGKMWGKTAPTHIFKRTIEREGRKLTAQYQALLLRKGAATVTGE
jgi:hypothetical protein